MKKTAIAATLLASLSVLSPTVIAEDDDRRGEYREEYREEYRPEYREQYQERHRINMELMKMLANTMEIVRDLNHKPSDKEKEHLNAMIKEMNRLMERHREMDKWMEKHQRDGMRYRDSDDRDRDRMHERRHDRDDR